jgi:hypothetical protein
MSELKVNVNSDHKEIIIREGDALPAKANKSILINGVLSAPFQFLEGKRYIRKDEDIHLQVFNSTGTLVLRVGDQDPHTEHVITGSLSKDKVLESFGINSPNKTYPVREFIKFIKPLRYYFADPARHTALIESLQKWSVKVERVIVDHNDLKGNTNFQLETKVKEVEGFVGKFDLNIPIFQGYPKLKFSVEIGFEPKNSTVDLFLVSDELFELEIQTREKLISEEVAKFSEFAFSKVVVN